MQVQLQVIIFILFLFYRIVVHYMRFKLFAPIWLCRGPLYTLENALPLTEVALGALFTNPPVSPVYNYTRRTEFRALAFLL